MLENREGLVTIPRREGISVIPLLGSGRVFACAHTPRWIRVSTRIHPERERGRGIKRRGASRRESARGQTARELLRETPPLAPPLPLPGHPPRAPIQDGESLVCTACPCSARAIHPDLLPTFFVWDFSVSESACAGIAAADVLLSLHGSDSWVNSSSEMCELLESDPFFFKW